MYFLIGLFLGWLLGLATPPFYKWIVSVVTKKNSVNTLLIFFTLSVALMSCGSTTGDPFRDNIGFTQAWKHVAGFASYWIGLIVSILPSVAYWLYLKGAFPFHTINPNKDADVKGIVVFVCFALILAALLISPGECAANTTIEQAARGVYIR